MEPYLLDEHDLLPGTAPARAGEQERTSAATFIGSPYRFCSAFTPKECASIVELGHAGFRVDAGLARPIENYRIGFNTQIQLDETSRWVYRRVSEMIVSANHWYRFAITNLREPLLYCEYPVGGRFGWHVDCAEAPTGTRKISASVQLSAEDEYSGGALEFAMLGEVPEARTLGTIITFPSFMPHRVEPVSSGVRRSLVAWMHGPVFR